LEFSAIPFEEVSDLLMEIEKEQAKSIKEIREELIRTWQANKKSKI